jgi:TP901 family phage tail tape measure protein
MAGDINYTFVINGNAYTAMDQLIQQSGRLTESLSRTKTGFEKMQVGIIALESFSQVLRNLNTSFQNTIQPGIALNTAMADLSAITGETGESLKAIERAARTSAKTFGLDAANAVESYKIVLSKLNPEIAKTPEALQRMGDVISVLSKQMGGDTVAAADVLTTAMNQFQVSTENPIAAAEEMSRMMNVMAAAAREGSAELPQIQQALEQAGMAAKTAGVSFEETNAAIQVLDKAGKKGSEGGVALRNVMGILSRGRFLPKATQQELKRAGVDINALTDKTKSMTERLRPLRAVMNDSALITKLFGVENSNAAIALLSSLDTVDEYTNAITGTNTAYEQADVIMESFAEKQARIKARFDDIKISIFNATGDMGIWASLVVSSLAPMVELTAMCYQAAVAFKALGKTVASTSVRVVKNLRIMALAGWMNLTLLNASLAASGGMFQVFRLAAVSACRAVGVAIMSIPIIGWIAAAIAAIIVVFKLLWEKSEGFRRMLFGVWEVLKSIGSFIWSVFGSIFTWIWERIKATGELFGSIFSAIANAVTTAATFLFQTFQRFFSWLFQKFSTIGTFIKKNFQPVINFFTSLWDTVKSIFGKILSLMGKVFNPIIKLWNKLTGKITETYATGAEKGSASWNRSQQKNSSGGISTATIPGVAGIPVAGNSNGTPATVTKGTEDIVTGGTRNTTVNISFKDMVGNMNFTGGFGENREEIKNMLATMFNEILGTAETQVN